MPMRFLRYVVLIVMLPALSVAAPKQSTKIRQLRDKVILRRGNFVIAATTDGYVCYGTRNPRATNCHRAVTLKGKI
jgi:hypothetical protein